MSVQLLRDFKKPSDLNPNPAASYLNRLSAGSRPAMKQALKVVAGLLAPKTAAESFPWSLTRYEDCQLVRTALAERYAPAAANKILSAFRGVLLECYRLGLISTDDYHRLRLDSIKGERVPKGRAVKRTELRLLFEMCGHKTNGSRDAALIAVLYAGGLRRAEAAALDLSDYDASAGSLKVLGKGNKQRIVYLATGARAALDSWIAKRGDKPGPLFTAVNRYGSVLTRRMSTQTIYDALARRADDAGVKSFSPHDLRRTFIGDLLEAGADISTVQKLAGHASVVTTQRYDRRGEEVKKKAAELLDVPYIGD